MCVCVSLWALSRLNGLTYGHEIWHRDWPRWNLGQVDGQRRRSKFKVTRSKTVMSMIFWLQCQYTKCRPMVWHYDVMWRHGMASSVFALWDRFGTREVQQQLSVLLDMVKVDFHIKFIVHMSNGSVVRAQTHGHTNGTDSMTSTAGSGNNNSLSDFLDEHCLLIYVYWMWAGA